MLCEKCNERKKYCKGLCLKCYTYSRRKKNYKTWADWIKKNRSRYNEYMKNYMNNYIKDPEVKEQRKRYIQEYKSRPGVRDKMLKYQAAYRKAAKGKGTK